MSIANEFVVETRKLTKVFKDFWLREKVTAVSNLDLQIAPREVFGLLGPNGSGKTTTIKMILGLLFPTRGRISVFGRLPTDVEIKHRIGFLPEESYLYPFLDARETLDFYGRLFHQPRSQRTRRIDMLLDMVGLSSVAYRRVGEYSKGMQRRIGLAQALINDPDLLILDEPTSGMDPIGTKQFKDLIETLALRGKTIILSSHLLADVEEVCSRVCILYGGKQRAEGTIETLLDKSDLTQIVTEQLSDAELETIQRQLALTNKKVLEVTTPRDKLESLFLRIVQQAQEQRLATGGALAGGKVAEFLRGEGANEGRKVIEGLVSAAQAADREQQATETVQPKGPKPVRAVLEELTTKKPAKPEKVTPSPAQPAQQADRTVLDDLLKRPAREEP